MPEDVELGMRSRKRRRRAVAETDDGYSSAEVEVLAPRLIPHPAALAADDRDIRAGIGRQHHLVQS